MSSELLRKKDLARIHLAKKELGLDDDSYRALLQGTTGKTSSKDLTTQERWRLMQALEKLGAKSAAKPQSYPGKPAIVTADKSALIGKIEAQLADAGKPWSYAHGIAKRMFKLDQVQLCDPKQLHSIVAALGFSAKRSKL